MRTRAQITADRAAALARAEAANALAVDNVMPADALANFNAAMSEVERFDAELAQVEESDNARASTEAARARLAAAAAPRAPRSVPRQERPAAVVENVRERVQDDPRRGFAHMGDFAARVQSALTPGHHLQGESLNVLGAASGNSQGVGPDGGYLVPPEFATTIWDGLNRTPDNLLGRTDQYTITGESLTMNANAETSRATGSRYGGIQGYWIQEAGQLTTSKPKFRQVKLEPQQLAVMCFATDKLLANPISLDQWLTRAATEEINFLVGDSIINGTGAGKPKGVLASAGRVTVAKETGQAAATIVKENIDKMYSRLHLRSLANAVWFINQEILPQLESMSQVVGTGGVPVYLPPGGITEAPNARLKGRPVIAIEYCQALGTEGDIILADLSAYASGVKGGIQTAMSMHLRFDYAETAFRFMFAVDGQPWINAPITPFKGSATTSPFVTLAAR